MADKLAQALDGARFVQYDPKTGLTIAWHGGHRIRVYNAQGKEVGTWAIGDYSRPAEEVTLTQVAASVQERMQEDDWPWCVS